MGERGGKIGVCPAPVNPIRARIHVAGIDVSQAWRPLGGEWPRFARAAAVCALPRRPAGGANGEAPVRRLLPRSGERRAAVRYVRRAIGGQFAVRWLPPRGAWLRWIGRARELSRPASVCHPAVQAARRGAARRGVGRAARRPLCGDLRGPEGRSCGAGADALVAADGPRHQRCR